MNLPFSSKSDLVVGLDIGSHAIKVCQLKKTGKGYAIVTVGSSVLPEGAVEDGTINDAEVVSKAITELFSNLRIKNKKVGFSISGYSVIVKKVNLAVMDDAQLEEHIMAEAETLCDRVAIIDYGKLLALGSVEELKASLEKEHVTR